MSDSRHGVRWHSADPNLSCPMARNAKGEDFFVYEGCLVDMVGSDNKVAMVPVIPMRWYMRDGQLYAKVRQLLRSADDDGIYGYFLHSIEQTVQLEDFRYSYPRFLELHESLGLPSPARIYGMTPMTFTAFD